MKNTTKQEIIAKATIIEEVALTPELIEKREQEIVRYNKAVSNVEGSAWNFARTVYSIIHSDDFGTMFGTVREFAKEVGTTEGTLSKLNKVYARKLSLGQRDDDNDAYTTGQLMEFGSIPVEETSVFITEKDVKTSDTIKAIRSKAKAYIEEHKNAGKEDEVVEADTTPAGESESECETETAEESTIDCLIVEYNGVATQIMNAEKIARIMAIVNE